METNYGGMETNDKAELKLSYGNAIWQRVIEMSHGDEFWQ